MLRRTSTLLAAVASLTLIGCGTTPLGKLVVLRSIFGDPSLQSQHVRDARLFVTVINKAALSSGYHAQNVSGAGAYTTANLGLSGGTLVSAQNKTINISGTSYTAAFTGIKPGSNFKLTVSLRNAGGSEVGNGTLQSFSLVAGAQAITIIISADGSLNISADASSINSVVNSAFVRGDTVDFNTGFAAAESGVASMSMVWDSNLYTGGPSTVATAGANFNAFTNFNTGASSSIYDATKLVSPANTATGNVTFILFNASNAEVGRTVLPATVSAGAQVDLKLQ